MLKPGMFISDRYEIIDKVGSGGMADVYKARDQRLNRFVAIKVLKPEYSSDKSFVNKFRGEAQSAAGLSHPNIVNVYDVGDDSGLHYIVMELVEGITLKRFIERKGKLEVKEAVGIGIQIAQGMEAAHDNHIIHRDIKPQNIIISRDGKVKVTDFGIAKATNSNTITSNAMGSVHYLSPEQARGGYSDEKSDIYSLGVTLYEMLSGKVPFAGDNTVSVALLHIQGEAMPLRELDPEIPVSVDKIVQKCMQKRPERRYHSASELIADLKRAITNPDGDFVQIPAFVAPDSPTINISDDLGKIKSGTYVDDDLRPTKNLQPVKAAEEDDEDLDTVDSKVEKVFLIGTIVTAVILALVIISLVVWFLASKGHSKTPDPNPSVETTITPTPGLTQMPSVTPTGDTYLMPDVTGLTKDKAEEIIKGLDPNTYITYEEGTSDTYEAGEVMEQFPKAENQYQMGKEVILTISNGPEIFNLPSVYGLTEALAESKLTEKKLVVSFEYQDSDTIAKGLVISTTPERDTPVKSGDTVVVTVSNGIVNKQVDVPDLTGMTESEAKAALKKKGLKLGEVTTEASDTFDKGQITSQSDTVGLMVDPGTAIDVVVSTGPEDTTYVGYVAINFNPLENIEQGEKAEIILEMEQDGEPAFTVFSDNLTSADFPRTIPIESQSSSTATVKMLIDGEPYIAPGESQEYTWEVTFAPKEN